MVSSQQLSKWGSCGGRPRKWTSEAERKRWARQQKKGSALREYRSYGEQKIDKYLTCPYCGNISHDLGQYFDKHGEFIAETWWFDTIKMEKVVNHVCNLLLRVFYVLLLFYYCEFALNIFYKCTKAAEQYILHKWSRQHKLQYIAISY